MSIAGRAWRSILVVAAVCGCTIGPHASRRHAHHGVGSPSGTVRRSVRLGTSVRGRSIDAVEIGDPASTRRVLVVGCIHGNEPAGIAVARALANGPAPAHADLWVIPVLNPDGLSAQTRGNARGVDLNRNFPANWRALRPAGSDFYSGREPLSEPESRSAAGLIHRIRPTVGIWFHQHMAVVDTSEGPKGVEQRFARQVGLPARALIDFPGSATSWENTVVHDSAFVVELPPGSLSIASIRRYVAAVRTITNA